MRTRISWIAAVISLMAIGCDAAEEPKAQPSPASPTAVPSPSALPTPSPSIHEACSASELAADLAEQEGLPPAVAEVRLEIARLGVACDYEGLEALAFEGRDFFSFSFGADDDPARYWKRDDRRFDTLATLVKLFELPYVTADFQEAPDEPKTAVYSWPSANGPNPTDEDWQLLVDAGLYTEKEVSQMKRFGGYIGYRIGILEDGDWIYFIAGD